MGMNPAMARAIAQADTMGGGNWPKDGRYVWAIERIWLKDGYKGMSLIINAHVVESTQTNSQVQPNAVGSSVSYPINYSKNPVAKQLIKTALCGILNEEVSTDPVIKQRQDQEIEALLVGYNDSRTGRAVPAVTDREQPLRGYLVAADVWTGQTAKGTPITKYNFTSIKMSDQDRVQWRAKLDKEKPLGAGDPLAFGQPSQPSQFGQPQPSQFGQPQSSQFGQPQSSQFGQPQPSQPSQFGQPQPSQPSQPSQFGQPQPSQPSQFGQPQPSQFGQPQSSQFGQPQWPR